MQEFHLRLARLWDRYMDYGMLMPKENIEFKKCLSEHLKWVKDLWWYEALADASVIMNDPQLENEACMKIDDLIHDFSSKGGKRV